MTYGARSLPELGFRLSTALIGQWREEALSRKIG